MCVYLSCGIAFVDTARSTIICKDRSFRRGPRFQRWRRSSLSTARRIMHMVHRAGEHVYCEALPRLFCMHSALRNARCSSISATLLHMPNNLQLGALVLLALKLHINAVSMGYFIAIGAGITGTSCHGVFRATFTCMCNRSKSVELLRKRTWT